MLKNATIKQIHVYTFFLKHEMDKYKDMIN